MSTKTRKPTTVVQLTTQTTTEPPKRNRKRRDQAAQQLTIAIIGSRTQITRAMITKTQQLVQRIAAINGTLLINNDAGIASIARAEALKLGVRTRIYTTNSTTLAATPMLNILKHSSYIVRDQEMRKAADWVISLWNETDLADAAYVMHQFAKMTQQNTVLYGKAGKGVSTQQPLPHLSAQTLN